MRSLDTSAAALVRGYAGLVSAADAKRVGAADTCGVWSGLYVKNAHGNIIFIGVGGGGAPPTA